MSIFGPATTVVDPFEVAPAWGRPRGIVPAGPVSGRVARRSPRGVPERRVAVGGPGSTGQSPGRASAGGGSSLRLLLLEVHRTRAEHVERQSERGATLQTLLPVRRAALEALENYSAALNERGWPSTAQMRLDIQLLRALCGVQRPHPPARN